MKVYAELEEIVPFYNYVTINPRKYSNLLEADIPADLIMEYHMKAMEYWKLYYKIERMFKEQND